jgi:hypothetical protein
MARKTFIMAPETLIMARETFPGESNSPDF